MKKNTKLNVLVAVDFLLYFGSLHLYVLLLLFLISCTVDVMLYFVAVVYISCTSDAVYTRHTGLFTSGVNYVRLEGCCTLQQATTKINSNIFRSFMSVLL